MGNKKRWWNSSLGYMIYPSSFSDSNNDGVGDIPGIISKLDYLKGLGVNLLWIGPLFASPMEDNGYDVEDYYRINPLYGNEADLKELLRQAHDRGIRIVLDFPLNHTSSAHPWFKKALEDPESEERGYYIFQPGRKINGKLCPPNNWESFFDSSAWEKCPAGEGYYLHVFSKNMPDLNWANPKLREKMFEIASYYLDMGVDGFRLDALAHLAKNTTFEDSPLPLDHLGLAYDPSQFSNRPELFDYLQEFKREVFSKYDCLILGEGGGSISPEDSLKLTDREKGSIDMMFNFDTVWQNGAYLSIGKKDRDIRTEVIALKDNFMRWYSICHHKADMPIYWCNHDHPRLLSQYGDIRYREKSAKCLLTVLMFLYGTPFIYQGDEIGMSNVTYLSLEDFSKDVSSQSEIEAYRALGHSDEAILDYLNRTSRVNARTPFQWNSFKNAGFSEGDPQFKVNLNYLEGVNVALEERDPDSILSYCKYLLSLRNQPYLNDLVINGELSLLDHNHPDVFAFVHEGEGEKLIVIANFRPYVSYFSFYAQITDVVLHTYDGVLLDDHVFTLRPYECYVLKVA